MKYIDTHCHIDSMKNVPRIIQRAKEAGVEIVNNGGSYKSNRNTLELKEKYRIKAALGIDPIDVLKMTPGEIDNEIEFIRQNKDNIVGIGEVGIDLKWSKELSLQEKNFQKVINLAKELNKPLIVHTRLAEQKIIELLEKNNCNKVIMHCFSGNMKQVKQVVDNEWILSIPANVTFSEHFQKIVKNNPIENLLCETDSPYLHPIKGKRNNEPKNVIESYKKIAEIKGMNLDEVKKKIYENFERLTKK